MGKHNLQALGEVLMLIGGQGNRFFLLTCIMWQPSQIIYLFNCQLIHFPTIWDRIVLTFWNFLQVLVDFLKILLLCFKAYLVSTCVPVSCNKSVEGNFDRQKTGRDRVSGDRESLRRIYSFKFHRNRNQVRNF